ncbi:MAG TPA: carbohydrate kinase [Mycobacteriales bacterium]|nr:carbohydrate kinase [Mycobacteriales bacterium]
MIVVCGEALIDLVPLDVDGGYTARPGGSPTNVAVGLGRLGSQVQLLARLSGDPFGRQLAAHVEAASVDTSYALEAQEPTTLAVVTLDDEGRAEYAFYVDGAADGGWRPADLPAQLPVGAALHVSGSLALAVASMGETVEELLRRERGSRVLTLDPNVRPRLARDEAALRTRLDGWLRLVDVVKVSSDDLDWVAPGQPVEQVAASWLAAGPALVVVTRGEHGVHAVGAAGTVDLAAGHVDVVDTVGAGDAFMAGLLCALDEAGNLTRERLESLSSDALHSALAFAQTVAAETCRRVGADPPWRAELAPR